MLLLFWCGAALARGAIATAGFGIGATDALLSALFGANDVKACTANNQRNDYDDDDIGGCHTATSRRAFFWAASRAISRSLLIIKIVRTTAKRMTIAHPKTGIQRLANCTPEKSVPKK